MLYECDRHVDVDVHKLYFWCGLAHQVLPLPKVLPNLNKINLISQNSLRLDDVLGRGAFGTVYKGYWQSEGEELWYTVAVKVLNENTAAEATSELLDVSGIVNVLWCACVCMQ